MTRPDLSPRRQFVLDTNVLINDPLAIYSFKEHDVVICMTVIQELDHIKDSDLPKHQNAKQDARLATQQILKLVVDATVAELEEGVRIGEGLGCLRIIDDYALSKNETGDTHRQGENDSRLIAAACSLQAKQKARDDVENYISTVLVTQDLNARLKSLIAGLDHAEEYKNDQVVSDINYVSSGYMEVPDDFTSELTMIKSKHSDGKNLYFIPLVSLAEYDQDFLSTLYPNQYLYNNEGVWRVMIIDGEGVVLEYKTMRQMMNRSTFGIKPKDNKQAFAIDALLDPDIKLVHLLGGSGSGKTLLSLAAGLGQTLDDKLFSGTIVTRTTTDLAESVGYLPGSEFEKLEPWLGAITDTIDVLSSPDQGGEVASGQEGNVSSNYLMEAGKIEFKALTFMRGRSINSKWIILDESQNMTGHQVKTAITRVGQGAKIILLGNVGQIDARFLTAISNGLVYSSERFKHSELSATIVLEKGVRSELSALAEELL